MVLVQACGGSRPGPPVNLPPPERRASTVIEPGDRIEVSILGEKDLHKDYQVQPDGSVDLFYAGRLVVSGLEPQQVSDLIRTKLIEKDVYPNPQVSVTVKEYTSKKVSVVGAVQKPGSFSWIEGLTLVNAISQAGWFTALADQNRVVLTRKVSGGKMVTAYISVEAITDGKQSDVALQAGDTIKVEQRAW